MSPIQAFWRVSSLIKTNEGIGKGINSLDKPQYERRSHRCGWKDGLIEVDLMPTFGGEITPLLEMWHSRLTDYVVGKLIVPGLDFKLKGRRCD